MCMHEHTHDICALPDMSKVYKGVTVGAITSHALTLCSFARIKNRLDMKSTECYPGGGREARGRTDPEGCSNMGLGTEGIERGGNDARLNKLQSKGNVFKWSTWNYRGSNMERGSERVGSTGSALPLLGQRTWSTATATVMSSAVIQSKIDSKIGQPCLAQCHSMLHYSDEM